MRSDIRLIDMHLRDQRALDLIRQRAADNGYVQIRHDEIADYLGCHINTARAIVLRLVSAKKISIESCGKRGGYLYRVQARPKAA